MDSKYDTDNIIILKGIKKGICLKEAMSKLINIAVVENTI